MGEVKKARVLIVDDSPLTRATMQSMLEAKGHEVLADADNAREAVTLCRTLNPDVVFMDLIMPGHTGFVALKEILQYRPKAKVVMVSAVGQEQVMKQAILLGASGFLRKPFNVEELEAAIQKAMSEPSVRDSGPLTEEERKILEGIIETGVKNSTATMAKLYQTRWALSTANFRSVTKDGFFALFRDHPEEQGGVYFNVPGGIPLSCLLTFSAACTHSLVKLLSPDHRGKLGDEEHMAKAVLGEVGNILANSFFDAMGNYFDTPILLPAPQFYRGPKLALLKETLSNFKSTDEHILMCVIHMKSEVLSAECDFMAIFSTSFIHKLVQSVAGRAPTRPGS